VGTLARILPAATQCQRIGLALLRRSDTMKSCVHRRDWWGRDSFAAGRCSAGGRTDLKETAGLSSVLPVLVVGQNLDSV
jgi:hypothetical protein